MDLKKLIEDNLLKSDKRRLNNYRSRYQGLWTKEKFPEAFTKIIEETSFLSEPTFNQRLYHIYNDLVEIPICETCKTVKTKFMGFQYGYQRFCCNKCAAIHPDVIKKTCLEKYGEELPQRSNIVKEKTKKTCLEKYGDTYPFASVVARQKFKETRLERYGEEHHFMSEEVQNKKKNTTVERYGVDNYWKTEEHSLKQKEKNAKFRKKTLWPRILESIKEKNFTLLTTPEEFIGDLEFICDKGHKNNKSLGNWWRDLSCCRCGLSAGKSKTELELVDFLGEYFCIEPRNKKVIPPREVDVFIKEYNLAIEYDGIYWHGEKAGTPRDYHLSKTLACQDKGIDLIHIFEDEWVYKQNIVKSMLLNKLGKIEKKVYARKCTVKEIDAKTKSKFLEENHIQGTCISSVNLGLFYEEELVSVMTFGRRSITGQPAKNEMLRFGNKLNTSVVGGVSKLFKFYINTYNHEEIVSYTDKRWFSGKMYEALGFKLDHESSPNYWYTRGSNREHRVKYQKHKLHALLENFDSAKTEWQNMQDHGYDRIWDCGNLVYKWNKEI